MESCPELVPSPGEAMVRLRAAALNRRDVWIQKGQYAGLKFPIVLGSDGAGVVESVGEESDGAWIGKEVAINPSLFWGDGQRNQDFKSFSILGLPHDGTFSDQVCVPVGNLVNKPVHLSMEESAAIPLAGLTAYRALVSRAELMSGNQVLITGAGGGVSSFLISFAVALGATVYVTSGSAEKIEKAKQLGATGGANYKDEDWDSQLKEMADGFDVIVDSAGGPGFLKLIELANPGGRIAFFGATAGDPPSFPMRRVFWKQLSILGTTMGSPHDFSSMMKFVAERQIRPVLDEAFSLEEVNDAMAHMAAGNQFGKIVLKM